MDRATIEPAIKILLAEIHSKLDEAARIAKAARGLRRCRQHRRGRDGLDGYRATDLRGRSTARRSLTVESAVERIAAPLSALFLAPPDRGARVSGST